MINGRTQRRLVWNRLLPQVEDKPLNLGKDYKLLRKKQDTYPLPVVEGIKNSPVSGNYTGGRITLESNKYGWQSLSLQFKQKEVVMTVTDENGMTYDLLFGYKQWLDTAVEARPPYSIRPVDRFRGIEGPFRVAGSYGWQSSETLRLKAHYVNWISALDITFRFDGERVFMKVTENFSSDEETIEGKYFHFR